MSEISNKVVPFHQIDSESRLLRVFERVRAEIAQIETIEDAVLLRSQAEALRVYALQVKCSREVLDQIAETKVRAERRLGELLVVRPETRGGDRKSDEFKDQRSSVPTFDSPAPTLTTLGVTKFLSSRSQIIANISEDLFEDRIRYTQKLNRGRDLSAEMFSYAKHLKREQEREERRQDAAVRASKISPNERIWIVHGDFREVLADRIPNCAEYVQENEATIAKRTVAELEEEIRRLKAKLAKKAGGRKPLYIEIAGCKVRPSTDGTKITIEGLKKRQQGQILEGIKHLLSQDKG